MGAGDAVGLGDGVGERGAQGLALGVEGDLGDLALALGQVVAVGAPPVAVSAQEVFEDDEAADLVDEVGGQEPRQPDQGPGLQAPGAQGVDALDVLVEGVAGVIVGQVDDEPPGSGGGAESVLGEVLGVADVAEEDVHGAPRSPPGHGVGQ